MFATNMIFQVMILPIVISSIFMFAWLPHKKETLPIGKGFWSFPFSFGISYLVVYLYMFGIPQFPPNESKDWILFVALLSIFVGLSDYIEKKYVNYVVKILSVLFVQITALYSLIKNTWSINESVLYISGMTIFSLVYWILFEKITYKTEEIQRISPIITTGILAGATAGLSILSSSLSLTQISGAIGSVHIPIFLVSLFKPSFSTKKSFSSVLIIFFAIWINIWFYSYPKSSIGFFLIILAPLFSLISEFKFFNKISGIKLIILKTILVIIPIIAGLIMSFDFSPKDDYYGFNFSTDKYIYNS